MAELAPDLAPTDAAKRDKLYGDLKVKFTHDVEVTVESETSTYGQVMIEP